MSVFKAGNWFSSSPKRNTIQRLIMEEDLCEIQTREADYPDGELNSLTG
jgi:hypothetical protein